MGGGGSKAKSITKVVNDNAINIVQRSINECKGSVSQSAVINIDTIEGNVEIGNWSSDQVATVKTDCLMEAKKQGEIQQKLAQMLAQEAHARGVAGAGWMSNTKSTTIANIKNKFETNFKQEDINRAISLSTQEVGFRATTVEGNFSVGNIDWTQSTEVIAKGILNSESYSKVMNEITTDIEQKSTATETSIFSGLGMGMWLLFGFIAIIVIFVLMFGGMSSSQQSNIIFPGQDDGWQQ